MININEKYLKKLYINETLNKRKYFGYRLDIILLKILACTILWVSLYVSTGSLLFTSLIVTQVFALLTLLNKMIINNKAKKGKEKFYDRIKKDKFRKKLFESDYEDINVLLDFFFNQNRYCKIKALSENTFLSTKDDKLTFICFIKYFESAIVEKSDIRNYIAEAISQKSEKLMIISINDLSDDAKKLINDTKNVLEIELISFDEMYDFVNENNLLGDFYSQISEDDLVDKTKVKSNEILSSVFGSDKIKIYLMAAITIYVIEKILSLNTICIYISYYFLFLAIINILYRMYNLFIKKSA